jgi:cytochrome c553
MMPMRALALAASTLLLSSAAGGQSVEERLPTCLACHGETGQSQTPEVPSLGGQPEFYLTIQLYMFREKLRVVEVMNEMTKGLSDDDLRKMAGRIAELPPPTPAQPAEPARIAQGRTLVTQHRCNFCHRTDLSGEQNAPRLAGQREDYLVKTLREYKSNTRRGYDASMADVLYPITDEQILDLAHFLAHHS